MNTSKIRKFLKSKAGKKKKSKKIKIKKGKFNPKIKYENVIQRSTIFKK